MCPMEMRSLNTDYKVTNALRRVHLVGEGVLFDEGPDLAGGILFLQSFTDFYISLEGSFSAGSTPIFASKYSFCSIFEFSGSTKLFGEILKIVQKLQKKTPAMFEKSVSFSFFFAKIRKFWQRFPKKCEFCKLKFKKSVRQFYRF